MVSRTIFISAAILLLSTVTFAERQTNSLENDSRVNFRALKRRSTFDRLPRRREIIGGFLNNGLPTHEMKVNGSPQTNNPTASNQSNGSGIPETTKSSDPDEQAGDVFGEGDDQPDYPGQYEAKRSVDSPFSKVKPIAPGSVTEPFAFRRRALQQDNGEEEDRSDDDDDSLEDMEDQDTTHEAKRGLKLFRSRRDIDKFSNDIDLFVMKTQIGVDEMIYKTSQLSGGDDDDNASSSGLPNGHTISKSNNNANDAINKAKSISSSSIKGDVKAMHDNH